ncbi:preprotein translocase subunit SecA [Mycoplasma gypis]|nr:preprotein translocase subunit SecA [[Mycoplasma] gypis]MBN0919120.1 preprotein translocase subunit SecA [[Mycoplasma] gypis]
MKKLLKQDNIEQKTENENYVIPVRKPEKSKFLIPKPQSAEMRIAYNTLNEINRWESIISPLTDEQLKAKTDEFKMRLKNGETTEDIRSEVFAVSREATKRVLGKRPYDVQMLGGIILDLGSVAEMKTGEGKTITSIAPVYLNALTGENVIVSTVNEYLAERDATEMGEVFQWLGMSVGINKAQMATDLKRQAYNCDITYSIHSELGFDYLRDNMVLRKEEKVQRGLNFILLDEVDSILIDEAKTPLIISGGDNSESYLYNTADLFVRTLNEEDFYIDEETKSVYLTDEGIDKANLYFGFNNLYDIENSELVHRIQNSLRAHKVMKIDVEYIVRDDKIELVDSFTGRIMEGRAYSEGLQQAIQAKEQIEIEPENKTLATITYQNFFRLFKKLSGMTGTAKTEEKEFIDIYNMRVNVVPTNRPLQRYDDQDVIYVDMHSKYMGIVEEVKKVYARKQPILIGTAQVEDSERLHEYLVQANIPHTVLNAKQNAEEADIIANAGQLGAVTIATNMAGRGTDIKPSEEAKAVGGLYVLGTDRAESRRIDNQLIGRSGRQGDVGYSKFFLSLDDQLILRFSVQDKWKEMFKNYGSKPIEGKSIQQAFQRAQKKIEGFNYDNRKSVLNYDDVIRQQRDLIYQQRDWILDRDDLGGIINKMIVSTAKQVVSNSFFMLKNNAIDYEKFTKYLNDNWLKNSDFKFDIDELSKYEKQELIDYIATNLNEEYEKMREVIIDKFGIGALIDSERTIILKVFDQAWQDHINIMDKLRQSSNLVQYSQKNPYQVYTQEGSKRFNELTDRIAIESSVNLMNNPEAQQSSSQTINPEDLQNKFGIIEQVLTQHTISLRNDGYSEEEIQKTISSMREILKEQLGLK